MAVEVALAMLQQEGRWLMQLRDEIPTIVAPVAGGSLGDISIRVRRPSRACQGLPITSAWPASTRRRWPCPYGQQSRSDLQTRLAKGWEVTILPRTTDRCGRTVAEVISDININLVLVEDGQAFA